MPNITFQHKERLILTANPTSHEKATRDAKTLFCLEQEAEIMFYIEIAQVGRAELAPSSWRSLRCGSLISVVAKKRQVAEIHQVSKIHPVVQRPFQTQVEPPQEPLEPPQEPLERPQVEPLQVKPPQSLSADQPHSSRLPPRDRKSVV